MQTFNKIEKVKGELNLPGDKSISHRSLMFSALAKGKSRILNLSDGEDVKSTQKCLEILGVDFESEKDAVIVNGNGFKGFKSPVLQLNAGNSGTTARLISGILAAQNFKSEIIGDNSLSQRPMKRIIDPLTLMGGKVTGTENFTLPLKIFPSGDLHPITYEMPVASAQVKSAVLMAGLHLEGDTVVIEKVPSRDHTERMLGLKTEKVNGNNSILVSKKNYPVANNYFVPSDISTASFFIVLTLLTKNSSLMILNISLNETRTGVLNVLKEMGADIQYNNVHSVAGEPIGDIIIKSSRLKNIEIKAEIIPNIIDEIPILAVAGIFAEGDFMIRRAAELRGKESDRIKAVCDNFMMLGLEVEEFEDGFSLKGRIKNTNPIFKSYNDHRIAMSFGILSLLLKDGGKVENFSCANISNPNFLTQLRSVVS